MSKLVETEGKRLIARVFEEIRKQGLTQRDFARIMKLDDSYISRLKNAENLTVNQLYKLCDAAGLELNIELKHVEKKKNEEVAA
jgi:transcriptional regulator with XRE-family HTH domain